MRDRDDVEGEPQLANRRAAHGAAELRCSGRSERPRQHRRATAKPLGIHASRMRAPAAPAHSLAQQARSVCLWRLAGTRCMAGTPCAPAAPPNPSFPHPRIARMVCAPFNLSLARSRGFERPCDITRSYAHISLCGARGMRHPWRMKARARITRRYVTWPLGASLHPTRCRAPGAALPQRPARAARVCAPSLACSLRYGASNCARLMFAAADSLPPARSKRAHHGATCAAA
jgi:hypothetical protein